jgi:hypothetical protein
MGAQSPHRHGCESRLTRDDEPQAIDGRQRAEAPARSRFDFPAHIDMRAAAARRVGLARL